MAETSLTHSNELVHDAAFIYSQTISYLVRNAGEKDKSKKAFQHAESLAKATLKNQAGEESILTWLKLAKTKA